MMKKMRDRKNRKNRRSRRSRRSRKSRSVALYPPCTYSVAEAGGGGGWRISEGGGWGEGRKG